MHRKFLFTIFLLTVFAFTWGCGDKKDIKKSTSIISREEKEATLLTARKKIETLKLEQVLKKSQIVAVCIYQEKEICEYDSIGILNYQVSLTPILGLKGALVTDKIYIHVHSPGLSGFGHEENYGKKFLIFLTDDQFKDGHYAEGIDFIKAIILE